MSKTTIYPTVVLVGRTNVGKSTLFNRLSPHKKTIVLDREGVTRDHVQDLVTWKDSMFTLIDTGGIATIRLDDPIAEEVRKRAIALINKADLILFVCDVKNGLVEEDIRLAKLVHKSKRPTFLILNKMDSKAAYADHEHEFFQLGFDKTIAISGIHGLGIAHLLEEIISTVTQKEGDILPPAYKIVILGKPNVGKSSLMNLLLKKERSIVSEIPGTTREALSEQVAFQHEVIDLVDTAGVRRKRKVYDDLESLMVKSSLAAARAADIVVLMIDVSEGAIADQELKLLFYAFENYKCILLVFNKVDLLDEDTKSRLEYSLEPYEFILKKIPQLWISCVSKKNVGKVFAAIRSLWERCGRSFKSTEVNDKIQESLTKKPLYSKSRLLKLFKIRWVEARVPTFIMHVADPALWNTSHIAFIENLLRKYYDFKGCPIRLMLRKI